MQVQNPQLFHVGIKAFLVKDKKVLILCEAATGQWEVPGGRLNTGEEFAAPTDILKREIEEELGKKVVYNVDRVLTPFVRQRLKTGKPGDFVFLVGYLCRYLDGEIKLSHEHTKLAWADKNSIASYDILPAYIDPLKALFKEL